MIWTSIIDVSQIVRFFTLFHKENLFENIFVLFIYFKFVVLGGFRGRAAFPDHSQFGRSKFE